MCYGWWRPTLGEWTWCHCRVSLWCAMAAVTTNFGGVEVPLSCPMVGGQLWGSGAIAGCHCSVLWLTNFRDVDVVPMLGAIVGRQYGVLFLDAIAVLGYGRVPWVVFNFPAERRPSTFGIIRTHCQRGTGRPMSPKIGGKKMWREKNCLELLADVTLFSTLITQKLVFAIWGLCWYYFLETVWRLRVLLLFFFSLKYSRVLRLTEFVVNAAPQMI